MAIETSGTGQLVEMDMLEIHGQEHFEENRGMEHQLIGLGAEMELHEA